MSLPECTLVPVAARPDLEALVPELFAEHWPEFIFHDLGVKPYVARRAEYFGDLDFWALDAAGRLLLRRADRLGRHGRGPALGLHRVAGPVRHRPRGRRCGRHARGDGRNGA